MSVRAYDCPDCGEPMSYETTKHNGCDNCGFVPPHGAE